MHFIFLIAMAVHAVLFIPAGLEEFRGNLREHCHRQDILFLLVEFTRELCAQLIQLGRDQVGRAALDRRFIAQDFLAERRVNRRRRTPLTIALNSLVTILYRSPRITLNTACVPTI